MTHPLLDLADAYAFNRDPGARKRLYAAILNVETQALKSEKAAVAVVQKRYDELFAAHHTACADLAHAKKRVTELRESRDHWQGQHLNSAVGVAKHSPVVPMVIENPDTVLVVQMAVRTEREACARVCEAQLETGAHLRCAAAIRARGAATTTPVEGCSGFPKCGCPHQDECIRARGQP